MTSDSNRQATNDLASMIAQRIRAEYWQVSSLTGQNVNNFFYRLASILFNETIRSELLLSRGKNDSKRSIDKNNFIVKLNNSKLDSKMTRTVSNFNLQSKQFLSF